MMKKDKVEDSIQMSVTVNAPLDRAFDFFVKDFNKWWPTEYTWSQNVLDTIAIEPHEGGRCFERGPNKFECDWGRVLKFNPPQLIVFTWQISPNREPVPNADKASVVEVKFVQLGPASTEVTLNHHSFSNHGDSWHQYIAGMSSSQGWSWLLDNYAAALVEHD